MQKKFTQTQIILFSAIFFTLFDNFVFFTKSYSQFPNIAFVIGLGVVLTSVMVFLFSLTMYKWTLKPFLIILFIASSAAAYFMQTYGTVIDDKMIENMLQTDTKEVRDLLNIKLFLYIFILGIIPSIILYFTKVEYRPLKSEIFARIKYILAPLVIIVIVFFMFSKSWISFFREHKPLRYYTNPTYYLYNIGKYINETYLVKPIPYKHIGLDAKIEKTTKKQKLFIFILGEAARYDHFSLNGYKRDTNPLLSSVKNLINYPDVHSCGTETAVSVPCMFSMYDRSDYSKAKAYATDNVVDVLNHAGVNILWRDRDSGSKGVAARIKNYQDFNSKNTPLKDDILLKGLQKWVDDINNSKPIFIVLHTKGSHGPDYYKRYPKQYNKFTPVCKTNQLQDCSRQQVTNGYDNTILYTDHIIYQVIQFLKHNENKYAVGMMYMADHGESLGENGIYLHGLPYYIAPDVQKHPAMVAWFGKDFDINISCAKKLADKPYSQDNFFDTILGVMGIKTKVYNPNKDIYHKCYKR